MKKLLLTLCAACLLFTACNDTPVKEVPQADTAVVAGPIKPPMDSAAMMQACIDNMTPGDMHKMMGKWVGAWNEELTFWMGPDGPSENYNATAERKMILNGLYLQTTHKGTVNGMSFEGNGTMGYDNIRKTFVSTWIDNMSSGIIHMEGNWDEAGKTLTMNGKMTDPISGGETDIKEITQVADDNNHVITMYTSQGGKEFKSMEIKMTRKK